MIEISQHRYRTVSWGHHREQSKRSRSPGWGQRQPAEAGMNRKRGRRGCKPRSARGKNYAPREGVAGISHLMQEARESFLEAAPTSRGTKVKWG